jgi:hypothetical protein
MTEKQTSFRRIWKKFIGWTSMVLVAVVGTMILVANLRLQAIQQRSAATEATLAATIADRDTTVLDKRTGAWKC